MPINPLVDEIFDGPVVVRPKKKPVKKTHPYLEAMLAKYSADQPWDEQGRFSSGSSTPRSVKAILHDGRCVEGLEMDGHLAYHDWVRNKRVAKVTTEYIISKRHPYLDELLGIPKGD